MNKIFLFLKKESKKRLYAHFLNLPTVRQYDNNIEVLREIFYYITFFKFQIKKTN